MNRKLSIFLSIFIVSLLISNVKNITASQVYHKHYTWSYEGKKWSLSFSVNAEWYRLYKSVSIDKRQAASLSFFVTVNDPYIKELANSFRNIARKESYGAYDEASLLLAFVQSLPYTSDAITSGFDEYPRFPIETLIDGGGDCEDTSILYATLMKILGYEVVFFAFSNHVAVGVLSEGVGAYLEWNGKKYSFAETTGSGWKIGDLPSEFQDKTVRVVPIIGESYDPTKLIELVSIVTYPYEVWEGDLFEVSFKILNRGDISVSISKVLVYSDLFSGAIEGELPPLSRLLHRGEQIEGKAHFTIPRNSAGRHYFELSIEYYLMLAGGQSELKRWGAEKNWFTVKSKDEEVVTKRLITINGDVVAETWIEVENISQRSQSFTPIFFVMATSIFGIIILLAITRLTITRHKSSNYKKCSYCGKELPLDAIFCSECGRKLFNQ